MGKKLTQAQYITECLEVHNSFYSYPRTIYVRGKDKIIITCPLHGDFLQQAQAHKNDGDGCKKCASLKITGRPPSTTEAFRAMGVSAHEGLYLYPRAVYVNSSTPVIITCRVHNDFLQMPHSHLAGHGCKKCSDEAARVFNLSNTNEFKPKAISIHDNFYGYDRAVYTDSKTPLIITCPIHHDFLQSPSSHLSGAGCPKCMTCGYNISKPGTLYVMISGNITKVGITNRKPENRASEILNKGGPEFTLKASFYFDEGILARNLEKASHRWLSERYAPATEKFDGYTECFLNVDLAALLNYVTPLATTEAA